MCRVLKSNSTARLGRNISSQAGIKKPRPDYNLAGPAYCRPGQNKQLTRLGRDSYSRLGRLWLSPRWAGRPFFTGWASALRPPSVPARPAPASPGVGRCSPSPAGPVGSQAPAGLASPSPSRPPTPRRACLSTAPGWAGSLLQATTYQPWLGRVCVFRLG
jgi:hypothetical protein